MEQDAAKLLKVVPGTVVHVVPIVGTQDSGFVPLPSTQTLLATLQNNDEQNDSQIMTTMDF